MRVGSKNNNNKFVWLHMLAMLAHIHQNSM